MTTPHRTQERNLAAEKFEAEVREAEARLQVLAAQAKARNAKADMDEISGLTAFKDRVKREIADMKQEAASDYSFAKQTLEKNIKQLQGDIERANERYSAWDAAREKRFYARLDEADAKLKVWKAKADQKRADQGMKSREELAKLEEKISHARASIAEGNEKRSAKAQAALEDSARRFDEAYHAAIKRYESD